MLLEQDTASRRVARREKGGRRAEGSGFGAPPPPQSRPGVAGAEPFPSPSPRTPKSGTWTGQGIDLSRAV